MLAAIAPRIEQTASIIVTESRRCSSAPEQTENRQHLLQRVFKGFRDFYAVYAGQYRRMQKEIERINVIIGGLLKVKSVQSDLPGRLLQNDLPPEPFPVLGGGQFRTQDSQEKQGNAFSKQVRVGREIGREVAFDISAMQRQTAEPFISEIRHSRRSLQQVIRPEPRKAAKCDFESAGPIDAF